MPFVKNGMFRSLIINYLFSFIIDLKASYSIYGYTAQIPWSKRYEIYGLISAKSFKIIFL